MKWRIHSLANSFTGRVFIDCFIGINFDWDNIEKYNIKETLNDGQKDNDDEEKEGQIENDAENLFFVPVWRFYFIPDSSTGPQTRVQMKYETLHALVDRSYIRLTELK